MIAELGTILKNFPGAANQTRCFTHILNLVIRSILRQFDLPRNKAQEFLDGASEELLALDGDIEQEEQETRNSDGNDEDNNDNLDGWVDERNGMTEEEQDDLDAAVEPVRFMLTKVMTTYQLDN